MHLPPLSDPALGLPPERQAALMAKARELEAGFLSEMLTYAGLTPQEDGFAGGIGEEQFASFLRDEQAKAMVAHGGIGLAEHIFNTLARRDHDQG